MVVSERQQRSLKYSQVRYKKNSTIPTSGNDLTPRSTQLYTSARFVVIKPYLAPSSSNSKVHFSFGSCSIHSENVLIALLLLRLTFGPSKPTSSSETWSSSSVLTGLFASSAVCFFVSSSNFFHRKLNSFP